MNDHRYIIHAGATVREALVQLNTLPGATMVLFVTDGGGRLLGTVTDGDIRRALIRGTSLDSPVTEAAHTDFRYIRLGSRDVAAMKRCRESGITLLPVLDGDGRPVDIIDLTRRHTMLPLRAVIMAGGRGERLRPATLTTPKPLLRIEGKAIIDYNIEALAACGIDDITVTTRYLAEQLDEHFSRPVAGIQVKTVRETEPLGTIGSVTLTDVARDEGDTLVMNSDLLTNISFEDLYLHHISHDADITIATFPYHVSVPFAVMALDGENVKGLTEKPTYTYQANAGIYLFSNELLRQINSGEHIDAPDLIERAIADGRRVTCFPITGTWIDIGSPEDFRQAQQMMTQGVALKK